MLTELSPILFKLKTETGMIYLISIYKRQATLGHISIPKVAA